jgi:hypothetical protein
LTGADGAISASVEPHRVGDNTPWSALASRYG